LPARSYLAFGAVCLGTSHAEKPGMTLDFDRARQLCTQQELALVLFARAGELRTLTPRRLRTKMSQARGLRNKFRDLADRQARESRGKAQPRGMRPARGNVRTVEKANLFGEVLRRFEERAAKLDVTAAATERATGVRRARRSPSRSQRKKMDAASAARKERKVARSGAPRARAHVASQNRRGQARRDTRRSGR
jgi:hypothetical protein